MAVNDYKQSAFVDDIGLFSQGPNSFGQSSIDYALDGAPNAVSTYADVDELSFASTASFRYDSPGAGIRSTQQLRVDWSKFENHTFFSSAEVNVNIAFDKIINEFPFDGRKKEVEEFIDGLTGFEKHVYDRFQKNKGYLFFSGTQVNEDVDGSRGTFIAVNDFAGSEFPTLSRDRTGKSALDPIDKAFAIETWVYVASQSNDNQVIAQKLSGSTSGLVLALSQSSDPSFCNLIFVAVSGTVGLQATSQVQKGRFNHVIATFDRRVKHNSLVLYVDKTLVASSSIAKEFGRIDFAVSPFIVGSGSSHVTASGVAAFLPRQTFSGALDELRVWHGVRTEEQQKALSKKAVFAQPELVLYFKFNEPSGTLGSGSTDKMNRIVLDSSGNSLHSFISKKGFSFSLRNTASVASPMDHESVGLSPVLFPQHADVSGLNSDLLTSASKYDSKNPNLITRLVPAHYFVEGQAESGFVEEDGTIGDAYTGTSIPGSGKLGSAQLFSALLFVFARTLDEIKLSIDAFGKTLNVDYDEVESVPDTFLHRLIEWHGFKMPEAFADASLAQLIDADDLSLEHGVGKLSLRAIQNAIMRRLLTNIRDVIASKGTVHGIEAFFRAIGIDPKNVFRIREFGGPSKKTLAGLREKRVNTSRMLIMSASAATLRGHFLSSSRREVGYPQPSGQMVDSNGFPPHGISSAASDGLFTSGSWTYEAIYRFASGPSASFALTQSLARLCVTGTNADAASGAAIVNLVATSASLDSDVKLRLYVRPGVDTAIADAPVAVVEVSGANVFDGKRWHVAFGRTRNDEISVASSSYFVRIEKNDSDAGRMLVATRSFFAETRLPASNSLQAVSSQFNASGSFIVVGSQSLSTGLSTSGFRYLNATDLVAVEARTVTFSGRVSYIRFWSRALTERELSEHARNHASLATEAPLTNFNFARAPSGSFGRLRLDLTVDQLTKSADSTGRLLLVDSSQNDHHAVVTGLQSAVHSLIPETYVIDMLSPSFDDLSTREKVRVRSFMNIDDVLSSSNAAVAPLYSLVRSEEPIDDVRFSIDASLVDALDRDIINMFVALDAFDDALGKPETMFSGDYPDLAALSRLYFERLTGRINVRSFLEFFKWIDESLGVFIRQLVPRKTKFFGINFVVENHLLERPKFEYHFADAFLGSDVIYDTGALFLQQLVGTIRRM